MNPILHRFIENEFQKRTKGSLVTEKESRVSPYQLAKFMYAWKINIIRFIKDWILILAGVFVACFGLKGFLLPNQFIDGGAVGIALLLTEITSYPLWLLLLLVNVPFVLLGFQVFGRKFVIKTSIAIALLALVAAVVPFPVVTHEKLLVAVFGGFFVGAGIGLAVRGGSVIDGTEILALFVSRRLGLTMGDLILILNILIFSVAAWLLSVETAMYSLLAYMSAAKTVDFIVEGVEEYIGVMIISPKSVEIKSYIFKEMGRGVTVFNGNRGVGKKRTQYDMEILLTIITRLEVGKLKAEIAKVDPHAFIVMHRVMDIKGGLIKERPLH
jgi:uncharacterized membrane-anchored protein YitT (DUF2179 family)